MELDNQDELLDYIENSKKKCTFNYTKLHTCFSTCLLKTIICLKDKVDSIPKLQSGCDVIYHVFWILINYTNNLSSSIYLSERAILLYSEFLIMSKNPDINKELYYTPNIADAINFAYKKTIGPIKLMNLNNNKYHNKSLNLLKHIIVKILDRIIDDNYSLYFNIVDKLILKNYKIINNEKYYNIIFNNVETVLTVQNKPIKSIIIKLRCLFEYIRKIKNNNSLDFNYKLSLFSYSMLNVHIDNTTQIDCNINKLEVYKNIIKL